MSEKIKLPKLNINASFRSESFNESENTIDVIFTTNAPVRRFSMFDGPFDEILGMNPEEVRMERLENGAPVLDSHNRFELSDQIGVVEKASVDGQKGIATLRLSKRESLKEVVDDIKDGIIRNISVGYKVHAMEKVGEKEDIPQYRAVDWEPMEISVVTVPADGNAQIRKEKSDNEDELYECIVRGINMEDEKKELNAESEQIKTDEVVAETKVEAKKETEEARSEEVETQEVETEKIEVKESVDLDALKTEASKDERKRISEIQIACKKFDIEEEKVKNFINDNKTIEEVREYIVNSRAKKDENKRTAAMNQIQTGKTDLEKKSEGLENAMLYKSGIVNQEGKKAFELNENGRQYNNLSLTDMAKVCLEARGIDTFNMPKHEVASRAFHSTSDFKNILANVLNKSLRAGYQAAPQTFSPFTRTIEVDDLKEISRTQFGEGGVLKEVKEGEEYKHDTVSEAAEKYQVKKYGKIVNVTEETIINDDLNAFTRIPSMFGQRARDLESDIAWGIITANEQMADGNNLFSAPHANLITSAGVLSEEALAIARRLMRAQVGLDGMKLNLSPIVLAVPYELETTAEKLLSSISPDSTSNFNPFGPSGRTPLSLIVEPRLSDASAAEWYVMSNLSQIDMVEMAMLRGSNGPMISQEEGFDIDGLRIKIKHWVGAKALDHRGLVKSNGQA